MATRPPTDDRTAPRPRRPRSCRRPGGSAAFGGRFVPEALVAALDELDERLREGRGRPGVHAELARLHAHLHRPAEHPHRGAPVRRARAAGRAILLKREDLNHTGSHKINNVLGQALLTKRMGKTRVIAETGAGQHGVATATAAALLGLECIVYMGEVDTERQALNVARMQLLGAEVVPGRPRQRHAQGRHQRGAARLGRPTSTTPTTSSARSPGRTRSRTMVRDFHGSSARRPASRCSSSPAACPTPSSPASAAAPTRSGIFHRFLADAEVRLVGVEAGGEGVETGRHAARFASTGHPGVLHGAMSYLLQDDDGQTVESHSISAGLDYPGVGPEHAWLRDSGRAEYRSATDDEAMEAFRLLCRTEGIIPAIESAHALAGAMEVGRELGPDALLLVNLSGRGDKDMETAAAYFGLLEATS